MTNILVIVFSMNVRLYHQMAQRYFMTTPTTEMRRNNLLASGKQNSSNTSTEYHPDFNDYAEAEMPNIFDLLNNFEESEEDYNLWEEEQVYLDNELSDLFSEPIDDDW